MNDIAEADRLRMDLGPPEESHPLLESLDRHVGLGAAVEDPVLGDLLRQVVRDYIPARLNTMLRYQRDHPHMEAAGVNLTSYVVHQGPHCAVSLSFVSSRTRNLHWHPFDALFYRVNPGVSRVGRYRLPDGLENDVVDRTAKLDFVGSEEFAAGSLMIKRANVDVLDFEGSPDDPVLVTRLELPSRGSLEWVFDRDSLAPIGGTSTDAAESRMISMIRVIGLFPEAELEPLREATRHPSHSVRWAALQTIGKLDSAAALALLPGLTEDPHPHIRRAAERTLASLEQ